MVGLDAGPASLLDPGCRVWSRRVEWAEKVLREQEMPRDELRVVLTSADGELVRRHLDLHLERLDEWLVLQKRRVLTVGRILAEARDRQCYRAGTEVGELMAPEGSDAADVSHERRRPQAFTVAEGE